jgi:RNA polymerase sigma-70 factor, ECF subfamily
MDEPDEPHAPHAPGGRSSATVLSIVDRSFDAFYRAQYRPLLALAWSLTGRRDLGEELVQDAMLTVHRHWSRVRTYEQPGSFARRVLLNDATSAARRGAAEGRALDRLDRPADAAEDTPLPDPEFWSALRSLPERQVQAVTLHYLEDRSVAEIADILGIAANTVKVHLHRGRLALATALRPEEGER